MSDIDYTNGKPARRYFRFLNFIDSFDRVYTLLVHGGDNASIVSTMLDLGKSSALGVYVLLEDLTIVRPLCPPFPMVYGVVQVC